MAPHPPLNLALSNELESVRVHILHIMTTFGSDEKLINCFLFLPDIFGRKYQSHLVGLPEKLYRNDISRVL